MIWVASFLILNSIFAADVKSNVDELKKIYSDPLDPLFDCEKYLVSPPAPKAIFPKDESAVYYLSTNYVNSDFFVELLRLDLKTFDSRRSLNMPARPQSVLIGSGQKLQGAVVISFNGRMADCYFGPGDLTQLNLNASAKNKVSSRAGFFGIVQTQGDPMAVDLVKKHVFDLDPQLFQTRSIFPLSEKERPIYFDEQNKILWSLAADENFQKTKTYFIKKKIRLQKTGEVVIKFKEPLKVFFDQDHFGFVQLDETKHALKIFLCLKASKISEAENCPSRELKIPDDLRLVDVRLAYHAKLSKILFFANSLQAAKRWRRAFIIDLNSEKGHQDELRSPGGNFIANAQWIQGGAQAIFEVRDFKTDSAQNFMIFDTRKKTTQTIAVESMGTLGNSKNGNGLGR